MLNRLAPLLVVLVLLVFGGACGDSAPPRDEGAGTSSERTGAARAALTPGAGSVGSCTGNPARCTMVMLAAGYGHTAALKSDGSVWAWGGNDFGQLGDGTTDDQSAPVQVKGVGGTGTLSDVVAVAAGWSHTVALKSDGSVWAWGDSYYGQLGDGTAISQTTPVQVAGKDGIGTLSGIVAMTAGWDHTVALKSDGSVWTWGYNSYGQLGDDTWSNKNTPVQVKGEGGIGTLSGIVAVAADIYRTVALRSDGSVWTWGDNGAGQLGDGTLVDKSAPVQVKDEDGTGTLSSIAAVAAGYNHTVALKSDGSVWAWGRNYEGQLGDGTTGYKSTPVQVKGEDGTGTLSGVVAVAAGERHTVALKSDGSVGAWGSNGNGQLGDGTMGTKTTPVQASGLSLTACTGLPTCDVDTGSGSYGACVALAVPNGTSCDDGDPSTQDDVCIGGVCGGVDLCLDVVCTAQDPCHLAGTCNPATGECSNPPKADGASCDDGDPGTQDDVCTGGVCGGVDLCLDVVCTAKDQCHLAGTCDPATGECSNPPCVEDCPAECAAQACGNSVREGDEVCDSADLTPAGGDLAASCESEGQGPGALGCKADCSGFDVSGCACPASAKLCQYGVRAGDGPCASVSRPDGSLCPGGECMAGACIGEPPKPPPPPGPGQGTTGTGTSTGAGGHASHGTGGASSTKDDAHADGESGVSAACAVASPNEGAGRPSAWLAAAALSALALRRRRAS